ncbi:MAG: CoA transferase [Candidatus Nanopelagicales bacterium]|nr:CoA transferase [Candidatus Nanopelagicales bacterium]
MSGMLDGFRVLDLTMWAFCPSAARVLAEWGADVIHIENPNSPDPMRLFAGGTLEPGGAAWMFKHYNRGKRSIALNLASDEGREALYALVKESDVFITSFLPRTRKKLGFDVDDLKKINPKLIYAKGTGAGPLGPENMRGGYDAASWWSRGSLSNAAMQVTNTVNPPGMVGHGDGMSGLVFAGGICAALLKRERSGEAPVVDSSLMGTAAWFNAPAIISSALPGASPFGAFIDRNLSQWSGTNYKTGDSRFIYMSFLGDHQDEFEDLARLLDHEELITDPRFDSTANRMANSPALMAILDDVFATKTLAEWKVILLPSKGVWAPVQTAAEMYDDPQAQANRMVRVPTDEPGTPAIVMPPVMFDEDAGPGNPAPDFGQHTDEILRDLAGYDDARIAELRASRVIA